ncbi:MAG TPA: glycosyl hydrolase 53 family protein [Polyangiaceae bacterium]|nr:glycosyl hydrolase 53 family protein [Polyangiaceae bacterium]
MKRSLHWVALPLVSGLLCHCGDGGSGTPAPMQPGGGAASTPEETPRADDPETPSDMPSVPPDVDSAPNGEGGPTPVGNVTPVETLPDPGTTPTTPEVPPTEPTPPTTPTPFNGTFILGADISSIPETLGFGTVFVDTDGTEKNMLDLLKAHGFNYVRLRTFVNPLAAYGYGSGNGCTAKTEAYTDRDHTVAFAREVKAAGMGLLVDFHYSDTWADPGKQVIPEQWRGAQSVDELATLVRDYTTDVVTALVAAGARPDMVQVGNEITPGMLIHVPTATSDCYGNNSQVNAAVNGSANDWDNLAALLRAGIEGVHAVDETIDIMLHVENTESLGGVTSWVRDAEERGVVFDVLGLSAYEAFQGPSTAWRATLQGLAANFPELSFAIAEYNPERRLLNDIMRELPDGRGLGTFFWEPTQSGSWGAAIFDWQGNRATARAADFAEYDQMRVDFGL